MRKKKEVKKVVRELMLIQHWKKKKKEEKQLFYCSVCNCDSDQFNNKVLSERSLTTLLKHQDSLSHA